MVKKGRIEKGTWRKLLSNLCSVVYRGKLSKYVLSNNFFYLCEKALQSHAFFLSGLPTENSILKDK